MAKKKLSKMNLSEVVFFLEHAQKRKLNVVFVLVFVLKTRALYIFKIKVYTKLLGVVPSGSL